MPCSTYSLLVLPQRNSFAVGDSLCDEINGFECISREALGGQVPRLCARSGFSKELARILRRSARSTHLLSSPRRRRPSVRGTQPRHAGVLVEMGKASSPGSSAGSTRAAGCAAAAGRAGWLAFWSAPLACGSWRGLDGAAVCLASAARTAIACSSVTAHCTPTKLTTRP